MHEQDDTNLKLLRGRLRNLQSRRDRVAEGNVATRYTQRLEQELDDITQQIAVIEQNQEKREERRTPT